jgi:hypothetical protein
MEYGDGKGGSARKQVMKTGKGTPTSDPKDYHGNSLINNIGHSFTNIS